MRNILILADLGSPLMFNRISILKDLPYKKYILHNANNVVLSQEVYESYKGFIILEHPKIKNVKCRYLYSFFYTLFLLIKLNPKLIVVHWASRLYQNILLALWGKRVIVHTMGGEINTEEDCYGKKRYFTGILFKNARVITGKTKVMLAILRKNFPFVKKEKLQEVSWGVEKRFFEKISKDEQINLQDELLNQHFDFLFFSIRTFKRVHFQKEIIKAFVDSYGEQKNIGLLVSLQECDEGYLQECKDELGLDRYLNIVFYRVSHHKMHKYLQAVDCVISYKLCDGISQSLMESVASNRWIITKELINHSMLLGHKHNAYLIDSLDELKGAFTYVQNHKVEKSYNSLLDIDAQRKKYLEILKENFDV